MAVREAESTRRYCFGSGGVPDPVPVMGSHAAARTKMMANMKPVQKPRPRLVLWWEGLETWKQLAMSFPVFAVLTFLLNIGPFYQPIGRSTFYGVFEGGVLAGLLAVATRTERERRR
jgi:hypothetical protein